MDYTHGRLGAELQGLSRTSNPPTPGVTLQVARVADGEFQDLGTIQRIEVINDIPYLILED